VGRRAGAAGGGIEHGLPLDQRFLFVRTSISAAGVRWASHVPSSQLSQSVPVPLPRWQRLRPLSYVPLPPFRHQLVGRAVWAATACLYATENGGPCRCLLTSVTLLCGRGGGNVLHGARRLASRASGRFRK